MATAASTVFVSTTVAPSADPAATAIFDAFKGGVQTAAEALNTAINASAVNPTDPTTMIQMQVALANYNISLSVQSSVIKSIEETAKSITQKL